MRNVRTIFKEKENEKKRCDKQRVMDTDQGVLTAMDNEMNAACLETVL